MLRKLIKEPLFHFVVLGAALFGLYSAVSGDDERPAGEIVITEGRARNLSDTFARTWQRPPTPMELDGLIEDYIREEVLYREAVAIGLDRDDTIIRRRLRQKLEFVSEEAATSEPTEAVLADFLAANADAYRVESRLTFSQVYLDAGKRGPHLEADAASLLDALRSRRTSAAEAGDATMLEAHHVAASETEVERQFGEEFAAGLRDAPTGEWFGPVRSGYGAHLVLIETRTPGRPATLAEVRDAVARDWAAANRQQQLDAQYRTLRSRYVVRIEAPAAVSTSGKP